MTVTSTVDAERLERLTKLADLLDTITPQREAAEGLEWSMGFWKRQEKSPDCRTSACAAGWAASDPWFIERGLKLVYLPSDFAGLNHWAVVYDGTDPHDSTNALAQFFHIPIEVAEAFFIPQSYDLALKDVTPAVVADRVRAYIAGTFTLDNAYAVIDTIDHEN